MCGSSVLLDGIFYVYNTCAGNIHLHTIVLDSHACNRSGVFVCVLWPNITIIRCSPATKLCSKKFFPSIRNWNRLFSSFCCINIHDNLKEIKVQKHCSSTSDSKNMFLAKLLHDFHFNFLINFERGSSVH